MLHRALMSHVAAALHAPACKVKTNSKSPKPIVIQRVGSFKRVLLIQNQFNYLKLFHKTLKIQKTFRERNGWRGCRPPSQTQKTTELQLFQNELKIH